MVMLTDWFAWKNSRWHSCIYNDIYYYWHDSGSFKIIPFQSGSVFLAWLHVIWIIFGRYIPLFNLIPLLRSCSVTYKCHRILIWISTKKNVQFYVTKTKPPLQSLDIGLTNTCLKRKCTLIKIMIDRKSNWCIKNVRNKKWKIIGAVETGSMYVQRRLLRSYV